MKRRVLIVDDSAFMRKALSRMIDGDPALEVVGVARDGAEAVKMAKELEPDVITLDVQMPELNGLQALEQIMLHRPVPVLMLSSLTGEGAETTIRALELGALDVIDKSSVSSPMDIVSIAPLLTNKLRTLANVPHEKVGLAKAAAAAVAHMAPSTENLSAAGPCEAVLIGSSTGGPSCIQALLTALPKSYPFPIAVVQHMPVGFTRSLAERLNSICALDVREAEDGMPLRAGRAVIARAGQHLQIHRVENELFCRLTDEPLNALHRPSVDVLFASGLKAFGARAVGILLTGMGRDGAKGLLALKQLGALTVVQDEATSVVWGMPRAAVDLGAAGKVLSLSAIREELLGIAKPRT